MVETRIESRPGFNVIGCKTWIGGEGNEEFGSFWAERRRNGVLDELAALRGDTPGPLTNAMLLGLSAVERDPTDRRFHFYIAAESTATLAGSHLEAVSVPASRWAVFRNCGRMPDALVAAEMYAFGEWLPASAYVHAKAPKMEVYPPANRAPDVLCEFWQPVTRA